LVESGSAGDIAGVQTAQAISHGENAGVGQHEQAILVDWSNPTWIGQTNSLDGAGGQERWFAFHGCFRVWAGQEGGA
jgi:hypothetical protein